MSEELELLLSQKIFVPQSVREWTTAALPVSVRLWHVLQKLGYYKLRDLHGESYKEIFLEKNCGRKTIFELRDFIANCFFDDDRQQLAKLMRVDKTPKKKRRETIYIPQESRGLPLSCFSFSTRLTNVLRNFDIRLLGDLHEFSYDEFKNLENSGNKTVSELTDFIGKIQSGEVQAQTSALKIAVMPQELNLARFVEFVDDFLNELSPRDSDVLGLRFGATGEPLTLEEVGGKYGITRERVRQIQSSNLKKLKNRFGTAGENLFERLTRDCLAALCPLTPQLLVHWSGKEAADFFSPSFCVRLLSEFAPEIPVLPEGQVSLGQPRTERAAEICREIKRILSEGYEAVPLAEMFGQLKISISDLKEAEFLDALSFNNSLALNFDAPDKPAVKLTAKRPVLETAYQVLSQSERPLTPEEIIERAKETYGEALIRFSPFSIGNIPLYGKSFYLLDRRTIGLRKHFRLPEEKWSDLQNDFYNLLNEKKRPFSTTEVVAEKMFDWTAETNASEAAQILREDERFTDLRRFHFALAEWETQERGYLRDLVVRILAESGHPLTGTELLEQMQKVRSLAATSLPTILNKTEELQNFGYGFYGLKTWGIEARNYLIGNRVFVNRVVVRSEPPLTFGDLCRKLEIGESKYLTDKLWRVLGSLPKLRFKPNRQSPETILVHTHWKFEQAIQKILAQAESPLSAHQIKWELGSIYGATFDEKNLDSIKNCLENTRLFVRNSQDKYLLSEQIDEDDANADLLRQACLEILKESDAVMSADDLLEKMEAEDLTKENLSAEMLAVLLRGDGNFQEIGMNLFRAKR